VRQMVPQILPDARPGEMMAERGLGVDHSTIGRWVLRYAPELHKRIRHDTRHPNRSWRVDETYGALSSA
jgi:transposase-like protein